MNLTSPTPPPRLVRSRPATGPGPRAAAAFLACLLAVLAFLPGCSRELVTSPTAQMADTAFPTGRGISEQARARTLVLYDTTGSWGFLGEIYAQETANLVSHFGPWQAMPVLRYRHGLARGFDAVIYLGSSYDEPLPGDFLDDVKNSGKPVLWVGANIWQLAARQGKAMRLGWNVHGLDRAYVSSVQYKNIGFKRGASPEDGFLKIVVSDPGEARVLATAVHPDGSSLPWAVRSGSFTYVAEVPLSYVSPDDRYLVFADLLFDLLAPGTPTRHRALVRLEDVGPDYDPAQLQACVDALAKRGIPFSVGFYPCYRDPFGARNDSKPASRDLAESPAMIRALADAQKRGGTVIMHGTTHQYGSTLNPYSAASADDFEFYRAHVDPKDNVILDGPVPDDSEAWAKARLETGLAAFRAAGFQAPTIFETPHYAGSASLYQAASKVFAARYDQGMYFPGRFRGLAPDYAHPTNQFFPFTVRDVYGSLIIPENLGNVAPKEYNHHEARQVEGILASAARNMGVRDGFASFFYHPILGPKGLERLLDGLTAQGWTFVTPAEACR